jgi:hypothetical protein
MKKKARNVWCALWKRVNPECETGVLPWLSAWQEAAVFVVLQDITILAVWIVDVSGTRDSFLQSAMINNLLGPIDPWIWDSSVLSKRRGPITHWFQFISGSEIKEKTRLSMPPGCVHKKQNTTRKNMKSRTRQNPRQNKNTMWQFGYITDRSQNIYIRPTHLQPFTKYPQATCFGPFGPSSGLTYEQVPLILVHFGIPNCYKNVIKILCAT